MDVSEGVNLLILPEVGYKSKDRLTHRISQNLNQLNIHRPLDKHINKCRLPDRFSENKMI